MADYPNTEARNRLCETAEEAGYSSNETGCGVANAGNAVGC
jgi:hypothetical protein